MCSSIFIAFLENETLALQISRLWFETACVTYWWHTFYSYFYFFFFQKYCMHSWVLVSNFHIFSNCVNKLMYTWLLFVTLLKYKYCKILDVLQTKLLHIYACSELLCFKLSIRSNWVRFDEYSNGVNLSFQGCV